MILGICGKIASGKSEVLKILAEKGFYCIDADKIAHGLYRAGEAGAKRIVAVFGKEFLKSDGSVDRLKLRDAVFENENKLKLLNDIIHPLVYEEIALLVGNNRGKNIAIEAIYFDENFLADFVDKLIWVERPKPKIIQTLVSERGFSRELAEKAYGLIDEPADGEIDFSVRNEENIESLTLEIFSLLGYS